MRFITIFLSLAIVLSLTCLVGNAQTSTFTSANVEYELELPSSSWRVVSQPDGIHQHAEFIYGDRNDGYLRIRKEIVDAGTKPSELAHRDQDQKLRFQPGFVEGKEDKFVGRLNGESVAYEFTESGKPMAGRAYYLQADDRTFYVLRFTGYRDRLSRIRNQTDLIARSFHLK